MAVVSIEGVGLAYEAVKSSPVTSLEVEKVPEGSSVRAKLVRNVAVAGLSPMLPANICQVILGL